MMYAHLINKMWFRGGNSSNLHTWSLISLYIIIIETGIIKPSVILCFQQTLSANGIVPPPVMPEPRLAFTVPTNAGRAPTAPHVVAPVPLPVTSQSPLLQAGTIQGRTKQVQRMLKI